MTSLPTTASHGATPTNVGRDPFWKTHLKQLSSVFQFQNSTNSNINADSSVQNSSSDESAVAFDREGSGNVQSGVNGRETSKWYHIQLGRGMINDIKRRAPFYLSDWADAWDYRVVPATIYMYFANILPALAFSLDM